MPAGDGYRVLALHLHFGGDELSSRAEPIRERSIPAFVAIARADVAKTGVNGHATVNIDGQLLQLPTRISDSRSEEHTSELQSLMRISYAVFCLKKKKKKR